MPTPALNHASLDGEYKEWMWPILAPSLPYLLKLGNKAAEKAAEKVGESTWASAQALWSKLHPKVEGKEAAKEAAEDVAANPEGADSLAALRKQLTKLLDSDPALAAAIAPLLEEAKAAVGGDTNTFLPRFCLSNSENSLNPN